MTRPPEAAPGRLGAACYTASFMSKTAGYDAREVFEMGRLLTVSEVAHQLRVSNMTVYRLIKAGHLAAVRVGRGYRIREDDIRRYLRQRYTDAG